MTAPTSTGRPPARPEPITGGRVCFNLPASLQADLNEFSRSVDRPVARVVRAALIDYIDRHRETPD